MNNHKSANTTTVHVEIPTFSDLKRALRFLGVIAITVVSAIVTKEVRSRGDLTALAQVSHASAAEHSSHPIAGFGAAILPTGLVSEEPEVVVEEVTEIKHDKPWLQDPQVRFFNGRPVRPARTMTMLVTAYSPDWRSCEGSDDGVTASIHSVDTNDGCLVAADTRVLPMGSMITVPGYDEGRVVPVLDRGGAIKGRRLDVLYSSHSQARKWGAQRLTITVWEFADGMPADDYRDLRGTRRSWR